MRRAAGPEDRKIVSDETEEESVDSKVKGSKMIKKVVKYEVNGRAFDTEAAARAEELRVQFNNMVKEVEDSKYSEDSVLLILQNLRDMPGLSKAKLQKIIDASDVTV